MHRPVEQEVLMRIDLTDGLDALSPRQRWVVYLLGQGYRQVEIASIIGVSQSTVSRILEKSLKVHKIGELCR